MCACLLLFAASASAQSRLSLDPTKAITQYRHAVWTTEQGLPAHRISAIVQSPNGYLWLGTQEGLVRFDGVSFVTFDRNSSALGSDIISNLEVDGRGDLWIGTRGGGISRLSRGQFTTYQAQDGLNGDEISALEADAAGGVWVGTTLAGLAHWDGSRFHSYRLAQGLPSENISALLVDRRGGLWVGTRDAGLARFDGKRFVAYDGVDGKAGEAVTALLQDRAGTLWIGTSTGRLLKLRDGRLQPFGFPERFAGAPILSLLEDGAGSVWAGTGRDGLARLAHGEVTTFTPADGLAGNGVISLFEDREGSLWIGTQTGGLNRLQESKFTIFTQREGLGSDVVYSISEDAAGDVWFGTGGGGVSRLQGGRITTWRAPSGPPSDDVLSVQGMRDGSVWIGTYDSGLGHVRSGRFSTFTTRDGLPSDAVYSLSEASDGTLLMGTRGGLARLSQGHLSTLSKADGLSSNEVTAVLEGRDRVLWVGTFDGGLNRIERGRVVARYTPAEGLPSDYVIALYEDAERTLWIATRDGLARLRQGRVTAVTPTAGLLTGKVFALLEDGQGRLWMSSNRGVFHVRRDELNAYLDGRREAPAPVVYDRSDGLLTNEFNGGVQPAAWRARDGRLWFASTKGAVVIDPAHIPLNTVAPAVVIQEVLARGQGVALDGQAVLPPGQDKIEFHFAALTFVSPERVAYRYRLDGVDDDWVEAGGRREAFYTRLAPGTYTFHVTARNADGVWSEAPATLTFVLEPFFWQTRWFYLLCALGLVFGGMGAYRLRIRRLQARQRELEGLVEVRTHDLRLEKEKTEHAKAVIEAQAEKLRMLDEMKTRFFNNVSHEFRTPLTLNIGPLENALTGLYGPVSPALAKQMDIMLRNARRLLRLINQLLDLSKLDSGKMKLHVQRRNLVGFLEGVALSFTPFAEKKKLAIRFEHEVAELPLFFDPEGLEKVFFNLLSNAVKFTPDGGSIDVVLRPVTGPDGRMGAEVRVRDTGCGIPEADLPYVFDRFHQVDGTVSTVQEGTGIGLALVKELVELHGGTIAAASAPGAGTEFVVRLPAGAELLPVADVRSGAEPEATPVARGPLVEMSVFEGDEALQGDGSPVEVALPAAGADRPLLLIVDDNPDIREYLEGCLQGHYRVAAGANGQEGLERAREQMPVMDGYAFCRAVRADAALKHLPFILLTSRVSIDDKIEGLEAGADDYLHKPFNAQELLARVFNLLTLRAHEKALRQTNAALQEAIEMKSQVLRIAAHDLRNPLNNVREFSKILKAELSASGGSHELLDLIETASDQMLQLITQMLEAEALESGSLDLRARPTRMGAVAAKVVQRNQRQAEKKGQRLHFEVAPEETFVEANDEWLAEAMENLVCNAIKYSAPGKSIWVTVAAGAQGVRFSVRDEGPGLTELDKQKLFVKFQRLSARPTAGEPSTGLGLAIVKKIVEMHHGQVWVESEEGKGSTFTFELPAQPELAEAA